MRTKAMLLTVAILVVAGATPALGSAAAQVIAPKITVSDGQPGGPVSINGVRFGASELVDIHLGAPDGTLLGTVAADANGQILDQVLTLPVPMAGGDTLAYGVGETSGRVSDPDTFRVHPGAASLDPSDLSVGDATTFAAYGFLPDEAVSVSFPDGTPVDATADADGTVMAGLVTPEEPAPGGEVTAIGSGTTSAHYTMVPVVAPSGLPEPGKVPVVVTGFASSERVEIDLDGTQALIMRVSELGSGQDVVRLATTYGTHTITATGLSSQLTATSPVELPATMRIHPDSGPPGIVLSIESGPGWGPSGQVEFWIQGKYFQTFTADDRGLVIIQFRVPAVPPGPVQLMLASRTLRRFARATFTVTGG